MEKLIERVGQATAITTKQVQIVISLFEEGGTVPFIARYRKDVTGGLDEVQIKNIQDAYTYEQNLQQRKEEVIRLIDEKGKLTDELKRSIEKSVKLQDVEDLYRPYKEKRKTKATVAKAKGLEPLAEWILQFRKGADVQREAEKYVTEDVLTVEEALQGARDIIAEMISDDATSRQEIRRMTERQGVLQTELKKQEHDEKKIFEMYYDYSEPVSKIAPHRILAVNRAEKEDVLKVGVTAPIPSIIQFLQRKWIRFSNSPCAEHVQLAIEDGYKRLISPSIEREIRNELTDKAEAQAINVFSENLKNLLLQPPLKGKFVLGVDPAYRTGCKLAVVDDTGKVKEIGVIYPTKPREDIKGATDKVHALLAEYPIEIVAVGNGTASRETEQFVANVLKQTEKDVHYLIVNEAGASVYSASEIAREEFPDFQVEERSAVSIARRLQDPLAELVKIDPKSIGVGQYQHDVNQKRLQESLHFVVETSVNKVGVNVNTASAALLQYVAGLSKAVANNIVKFRDENGKITNRNQIKKVPRLGTKTFEQCVGFLRVIDGDHPLDRTPIHPESYTDVIRLLRYLNASLEDVGSKKLKETLENIDVHTLAEELQIGEMALQDIIEALIRPERDPRDELPKPLLKKDVLKIEDLEVGMELQGTVRNVVDFGAFVDVGLKSDGLVHRSKMGAPRFKHPMERLSVGDIITVWVEGVEKEKGRVSLTMISSK